jgi:hypothetical protein
MTTDLSERELATVLAALRYWQQDVAICLAGGQEPPTGLHFTKTIQPLTDSAIDDLCERLNCG